MNGFCSIRHEVYTKQKLYLLGALESFFILPEVISGFSLYTSFLFLKFSGRLSILNEKPIFLAKGYCCNSLKKNSIKSSGQ